MTDFLLILMFLVVTGGFAWVALLIGHFMRPRVADVEKSTTYECGERPFGHAWFNYSPRFYVIAIIFLLFDVALAVAIPALTVVGQHLRSADWLLPFMGMSAFLGCLLIALSYAWLKGDFDWIRNR